MKCSEQVRIISYLRKMREKQSVQAIRRGVRIIFKSSQSLVKWEFASFLYVRWYYFGTKMSVIL